MAIGDHNAAARIYRQTAWFNRRLAAIIAILTLLGVASVLALGQPGTRGQLLGAMLALVGTSQAIQCMTRSKVAGLIGAQRLATVSMVRVAALIASTICSYGILKAGGGVLCLPLGDLICQTAIWGVLSRLLQSTCPWVLLAVPDLREGLGEFVRHGAAVSLTSAVNYACLNCDPFLLQTVENGGVALAAYYMWIRFPQLFQSMNWMLFGAANPAVTAAFATDRAGGISVFHRSCQAVIGITLAGVFGIGVWLTPVVHHWMGGRYDLDDGTWVALAMAVGVGARNMLTGFAMPYYATNLIRTITIAHILQLASKIGLGLVLVQWSPVLGVSIADAASAFLAVLWLGYRLKLDGFWSTRKIVHTMVLFSGVAGLAALAGHLTFGLGLLSTIGGILLTSIVLAPALLWWMVATGVMARIPGLPHRIRVFIPTSFGGSRGE